MSVLLFRLKDVPEEEAQAVLALLDEHQFEYFETSDGRWGISIAAIWLKNDGDYQSARALLDEFQAGYVEKVQAEYAEGLKSGDAETFLMRLLRFPFHILLYIAVSICIAYFSVKPFLTMTQPPEPVDKTQQQPPVVE